MTLILEIEYLAGVCFAAAGPDSADADWPPQPDRVFSALVASWASRGESAAEAAALQWLEEQPMPGIVASGAENRAAPVSFVPANDLSDRRRQPRRFPAARPHDPLVRLVWPAANVEEDVLSALGRIAADTSYVGHSASLTRCRFLVAADRPPHNDARAPYRRVYAGRLDELRQYHQAFVVSGGKTGRPTPGEPARTPADVTGTPLPHSVFDRRWLVLEDVSGELDPERIGDGVVPEMPDIRAASLVAKAIRDTLLSGYDNAELQSDIPEVISGHAADGSPSRNPHIAIVPLSFAGFPHADGTVFGFALVPPRAAEGGESILDDSRFVRALAQVAPFRANNAGGQRRRVIDVRGKAERGPLFRVALSPTFERPSRRSLDPALYLGPSRVFATVTPIVLDRHLKSGGQANDEEAAAQIAAACRNIGLPDPERDEQTGRYSILVDKHSAIEGAPSARPPHRSTSWLNWHLPKSLASRALTHAVIRFAEPVEGPVILGAGRFVGLGLCRPYRQRDASG